MNEPSRPDYNERFKLRGSSFEDVVRRAINEPNGKNGQVDDERLKVIAQLVHDRRVALGWSRRKLADVAEVDQSTIKSLEDAERLPRAATLGKMAEALEVSFPV
jgi:ribosome-binding protein aMBF1 (putative translation factor)